MQAAVAEADVGFLLVSEEVEEEDAMGVRERVYCEMM